MNYKFDKTGNITILHADGLTESVIKHSARHDQLIELSNDGKITIEAAISLADAKAEAKLNVIARANAFTAPILSKYPEAERSGWDKREGEARAILAADDKDAAIAATDIIKTLALAANESTADTVKRAETIVAKAAQFAMISAAVEVMRDQALTAIDAVKKPSDMPATLAALDAQASALAQQYGLA